MLLSLLTIHEGCFRKPNKETVTNCSLNDQEADCSGLTRQVKYPERALHVVFLTTHTAV